MDLEKTDSKYYSMEIMKFIKSEFFNRIIHIIFDRLNFSDRDYLSYLYEKICNDKGLDPVEIETLRRFFHKEEIIKELKKIIKIIISREHYKCDENDGIEGIKFLKDLFLENDVEKIKSEILAILLYFNTILKQIGGEYKFCGAFLGGIGKVQKDDGKRYFVNKEGIEILPYNYVYGFNDGIGIVEGEDGLKYYISKLGNIISIGFDECFLFTDGIGVIKNDNGMFLVNKKIEQIAGPFDNCTSLVNGIGIVYKDGKYYYINRKGNIISNDYEHLEYFINGFGRGIKNGLWYLIDKKGNEHGPYKNIYLVRYGERIVEDISGSYKIIKKENENTQTTVTRNIEDKSITIKIRKQKRFYVLNSDLETIGGPYEYCSDFVNGFARVKKNGDFYLLCKSGREYGPYSKCGYVNDYIFFYQDKEGKYYHYFFRGGIKKGPFVYCSGFKEGVCIIGDNSGNLYFADSNYSKIGDLYKKCIEFSGGFGIGVKEDGHIYYISKKGIEYGPFLEGKSINKGIFVVKDLNGNRQIRNHRFELMRGDIKEIVEINEWVITAKLKNGKYIYLQLILKKALDYISHNGNNRK